jgi:hypothetical protein
MFARGLLFELETQAPDASLVPAEVMGELVTQGPLDLPSEQIPVVAKVAFQRVAIDDDPILIAFTRDTVPEVLAIRVLPRSEIGDDDSDAGQHFLKFLGKPIDRINDKRLEIVELGSVRHDTNGRHSP